MADATHSETADAPAAVLAVKTKQQQKKERAALTALAGELSTELSGVVASQVDPKLGAREPELKQWARNKRKALKDLIAAVSFCAGGAAVIDRWPLHPPQTGFNPESAKAPFPLVQAPQTETDLLHHAQAADSSKPLEERVRLLQRGLVTQVEESIAADQRALAAEQRLHAVQQEARLGVWVGGWFGFVQVLSF